MEKHDADSKQQIEVYGVRGMKSKHFQKTFKNQAAFEKWMEKNGGDVEIYGYNADPSIDLSR